MPDVWEKFFKQEEEGRNSYLSFERFFVIKEEKQIFNFHFIDFCLPYAIIYLIEQLLMYTRRN